MSVPYNLYVFAIAVMLICGVAGGYILGRIHARVISDRVRAKEMARAPKERSYVVYSGSTMPSTKVVIDLAELNKLFQRCEITRAE